MSDEDYENSKHNIDVGSDSDEDVVRSSKLSKGMLVHQKFVLKPTSVKKLGISRSIGLGYNPKSTLGKFSKNLVRMALKPTNTNIDTTSAKFKIPTFTKKLPGSLGSGLRPGSSLGMRQFTRININALHDPTAPDAIILYEPTKKLTETEKLLLYSKKPGSYPDFEVEVVIDPVLARRLRPHQVEGVKFLYNCTTGLINESPDAFGCIMADEMVSNFYNIRDWAKHFSV